MATITESSSSDSLLVPASASVASAGNRTRTDSQTSLSSSTSDASTLTVNPKRQVDFERIFTSKLDAKSSLEVVATQSCDYQASVLLHGRVYLTSEYLCFRSNILGYRTEHIHLLRDIVAIQKGTTAKWIQNAVYITVADGEDADGIHYGYGSMKDRDALYNSLMTCWKVSAPQRYAAMLEEEVQAQKVVHDVSKATSTDTDEGDSATVKHSEASGEQLKETVLDAKFPISLDSLYQLLYHNREFIMEFYTKDKQLLDVDISEWKGETKTRTMSYTMRMGGLGPSKSQCFGTETIAVEDPEASYEIESETRTPDVPSGKKFKIHTRTSLTHTDIDGKQACRMLCTTQCDWTGSSWLQGTITPAVIKGQHEHHQQLRDKILDWIRSHPDEFGSEVARVAAVPAETLLEAAPVPVPRVKQRDIEISLAEHARQVLENPVMLSIIALLLAVNLWQMRQSCEC